MYKFYFPTVKTWLQKVISPRAVWLVKVSISIFIQPVYMYNNNKVLINSNLNLKKLYMYISIDE